MKVLILSGGSGTRLWPLSRENFPKQFMRIFSEHSLFQETVKRALRITGAHDVYVITGERYEWIIRNELEEIDAKGVNVITEPAGRNTAPAIALGIKKLIEDGVSEEEHVIVLPSDHLIKDIQRFSEAVSKGRDATRKGYITLFGESPVYPETGYGYIKLGNEVEEGIFEVEEFKEKPDYETASKYIEEGKYLWNCGIFLFSVGRIIKDYERFFPDIDFNLTFDEFIKSFPYLKDESFDYAILERTESTAIVKLQAGWSDVGSWKSVYDNLPKEEEGNVLIGEVEAKEIRNSMIYSPSKRLVACVGLENCLIINTEDATLVVNIKDSQKVKDIVNSLKHKEDTRVKEHITTYTPFGSFTFLDRGLRYFIRKYVIKPGSSLPSVMHHHRTKHWIVLKGTAKVKLENKENFVHENESFFIPRSTPYKIENVGKIDLELIEIQSGEYLEEDDTIFVEKENESK